MGNDFLWYNNAIIYGLDISAFKDGNHDGTGDFRGAIEKLDYLQELGINAVWLLPFYQSDDRDNGYDVENYYSIHKQLGNFDDFMDFKREAEKHDIRLIVDLVVHHTSDTHPWFKLASHNKNSKYYHYYIWHQNPPVKPEENAFEGKTWKYNSSNNEYYHHKFYDFEPDLNIKNPEVRKEIKEIIRYWLDFGVSGFRLDAATFLFNHFKNDEKETPGQVMEDFQRFLVSIKKDAFFLAEADVDISKITDFTGQGNRMNMLLNFPLNSSLFLSLARGSARPIVERLKSLPDFPENVYWVNFVRNLDELSLGHLTKDEMEETFRLFAPDIKMQAYGRGIRRRLAPMLSGNIRWIKMVYNLLFSLPGIPLIVYGDEIGMGDNLVYKGRTSVRTPMQWNSGLNGGFSEAPAENIRIKPITEGIFSYHFINVEEEKNNPDSLLNEIKKFIRVRKNVLGPHIKNLKIIDLGNDELIGFSYGEEQMLFFTNFGSKPLSVKVNYDFSEYSTVLEDSSYGVENNPRILNIQGLGYRWFIKKNLI